MNPIIEIFSQGDEVVGGQVADTNAAWLSQQFMTMGHVVRRHTSVGDNMADMVKLLVEISQRADICICTGGLGPTTDDLTAEAVAQAFNVSLKMDNEALAQIEQFFVSRKRVMADSNRKQAMLPVESLRLDNNRGTAPGFCGQYGRCWFFFLPGVPYEMRQMFAHSVSPLLAQKYSPQALQWQVVKTSGIGESDIQQSMNTLELSEQIQISYRTTPGEIQTKLGFPADWSNQAIQKVVAQVATALGDAVFITTELATPNTGLVSVISAAMTASQQTLAVLETVSHGAIAAKCAGQPWFKAAVCYSDLAVSGQPLPTSTLDADWYQAARQLAQSLKQQYPVNCVLVQISSAKQSAWNDSDQAIVLYNVLHTESGDYSASRIATGDVQRKQNQAAMSALDLLRRYLQDKISATCHY